MKFLRKKRQRALRFTTDKVDKLINILTSIQVKRTSTWLKNLLDSKLPKKTVASKNKPKMKKVSKAMFKKIKKTGNMRKSKLLKLSDRKASLRISQKSS